MSFSLDGLIQAPVGSEIVWAIRLKKLQWYRLI